MSVEPFTLDDVTQDAAGVVTVHFTNRADVSVDVDATLAQAEPWRLVDGVQVAEHHIVIRTSLGTEHACSRLLRFPVIFDDVSELNSTRIEDA